MEILWQNIIGHKENIERLRRLAVSGRIPHALLFCGREGTGKRLVAQAFAAALLCPSGENGAACGRCASCRALLDGQGGHPDFFLLEPEQRGKSQRIIRIEAVRAMETELSRRPVLSARRVAIIDGAELMNEQAANCLLKTLEEPPENVVFILIAASRRSLLPTVVSRCTPVIFGSLSPEETAEVLMKKGLDAVRAQELAALADGSCSRAEELAAGGENHGREALDFLAGLDSLSPEALFQEGDRLAARERDGFAGWLRSLRLVLRDLTVLAGGGSGIFNLALGSELRPMAAKMMLSRLFRMDRLAAEYEKRVLQSNASIKLQAPAFLLRMQETRNTEED